MSVDRAPRILLSLAAAAAVALSAAGCSSEKLPSPSHAANSPAPPSPCIHQPKGVAQDGVNDEQGGSTPGVDPCDGPGN